MPSRRDFLKSAAALAHSTDHTRTSLGELTGEILIEKWMEMVKTSPAPVK